MTTCTKDGFNLSQTKDTSKSLTMNYLPMGLTDIVQEPALNCISAMCSRSASSNITYTENNVTTEYKANKLWIVSAASGSQYKLHNVQGCPSGELIIQNFDTNGDKVLYICYLLNLVSDTIPGCQIDTIFQAVKDNKTTNTVDLNSDIYRRDDPQAEFIQYNSVDLNPGKTVIVYTNPIDINSTQLMTLQNNLANFDMYNKTYSIIGKDVPGQWMECEYAPIDSTETAAFNLPLASEILESQAQQNSFKTIMMFIVFAILTALTYVIIPDSYLFIISMVFGKKFLSQADKEDRVYYVDFALTVVFGIIPLILILTGTFSDAENSALQLLIGITGAIFYTVCYIIIQSKKMNKAFIPGLDIS
jgi:heme/copper-type cytochrome/quinol oxidase subunit 4